MTLVVDASVAVKFVVREHDTDKARELLVSPDPLIAPDWLLVEVASTLWKKVKRSEVLAVHASRHLGDMPRFFQGLVPAQQLVTEAFEWSIRLRHPVYDCLYLALALQQDCMLVTADIGFVTSMKAGGLGERVRAL